MYIMIEFETGSRRSARAAQHPTEHRQTRTLDVVEDREEAPRREARRSGMSTDDALHGLHERVEEVLVDECLVAGELEQVARVLELRERVLHESLLERWRSR